jgi:hypothetical protein
MPLSLSAQDMFIGDPEAVFQVVHGPTFVIGRRLAHWSLSNFECYEKGSFN